jgi:cell division protein FtsL
VTSSAVAGLESAVGQAEAQQQQLAADTAGLSSQVSSLSSPQRVAQEAAQLGLVPANDVSYLTSGEQMLASEGDTTVAGR